MKHYFYLLAFVILFSGCSSDDSDDPNNNAPGLFSANNTEVTTTTGTIEWTESIDIDDDTVSYNIYLEGELVVSGLSGFTYTLTGLQPETAYDGYVEAVDGRGGSSTADFAILTNPEFLLFTITDDVEWIRDSFPEAGGTRELWRSGYEIPFYENASQYQVEIIDYRFAENNDEPCPCIGDIYTWTNEDLHEKISFFNGAQLLAMAARSVNTINPNYPDVLVSLESYYGEIRVTIQIED